MKPINVQQFVPVFYALADSRGEFYVYSAPDIGVRCSDDLALARKYSTIRGALSAQAMLKRTYGIHTQPTRYLTHVTYEPAL